MTYRSRPVAALVAATLLLPALPARADQTIELRSQGDLHTVRLAPDTLSVELSEVLGGNCRPNRTWGYDAAERELWVGSGCAARFLVRTPAPPVQPAEPVAEGGSTGSNVGAAVAVAAIIAGAAAIASHNKDRDDDRRYDDRPDYRPEHNRPGGGYGDWRGGNIRGKNGTCLDVEGGVRRGSRLIVYQCNGGSNQRFEWARNGELRVGGMCVDVAGGNRGDGAQLIAWQCNGQANQRWRMSGGEIRSDFSGKCMDIEGGRARPGQPVIAWRCTGGDNQRWSY